MKKIGILTFVFNNYGTILQTYALCQVLKVLLGEQSYSVEVVNMNMEWSRRLSNRGWVRMKNLVSVHGLGAWRPLYEKIKWHFDYEKLNKQNHSAQIEERDSLFESLKSKIPYTAPILCEEIRKGALDSYDILISGSDQIWNVDYTESLDIYFQSVLSESKKKNIKKLSYAASFGFRKIPSGYESVYANLIKNMDSILVREEDAVGVSKVLGRSDAKCVLDPTLLLNADKWSELISNERIVDGEYVLVYSLNSSYRIYEEASRLAKKYGLRKVCLKRSFCPPCLDDSWLDLYAISPENFLQLVKNAKFVVTNSFHALVFSITFNTNFFAFLEKTDTVNSRLESILSMLKLDARICYEGAHLDLDAGLVDFSWANEKLKEKRKESCKILLESIV